MCLFIIGCDASPFYTVHQDDEAIVTQNGEIVGKPKKPGLHIKIPFIQKVHIVQLRRLRFLSFHTPNSNSLEAEIVWSVQDSKKFFLTTQKGNIAEILKTTVTPKFNDILGEYNLESIVLISREQHKDPEFTNAEYKKIKHYIQKSVINFGIKINRIYFKFNPKQAQHPLAQRRS